ncbi:MAG TPA: hypothetical protein VJ728_15475 [Candidatus Binataceae bacterium]|nr:hypothetical protein [Candidatus Binataceae bacterium]
MAPEIITGRGAYRLTPAAPLQYTERHVFLALAMERVDGIERVVASFRIARELLPEAFTSESIIEQLQGWLAKEFEMTREAALKAIRSERRLHEITFDETNRGPF